MQEIKRKATSFRLPEYLLKDLKEKAKREHRSVNNFVEVILLDAIYKEPNETTLAAMAECKSGKKLPKVDTSSLEAFIKSIEQ